MPDGEEERHVAVQAALIEQDGSNSVRRPVGWQNGTRFSELC